MEMLYEFITNIDLAFAINGSNRIQLQKKNYSFLFAHKSGINASASIGYLRIYDFLQTKLLYH